MFNPNKKSKILITGENFGCGSSREHAPWSLLDFGFRCIIAPSFADIFFNNCFKNGILPVKLNNEETEILLKDAEEKKLITVDLDNQTILSESRIEIKFEVDKFRKKCLLEGLDDIALTLEKSKIIDEYEDRINRTKSWSTL